MKLSAAAAAVLLAASGASAYSTPTRSSIRSLGHKSVGVPSAPRNAGSSNLKMEGLFAVFFLVVVPSLEHFV